MRRRLKSLAFVAAAALAACFGAGPAPTQPTAVTVVYAPPIPSDSTRCSGGATYIGDVAFGSGVGYAIPLPYTPDNCNNGGSLPMLQLSVMSFPESGDNPDGTMIGSAGNGQDRPRLGANGSNVVWSYQNGGNMFLAQTELVNPTGGGGQSAGIVLDANAVYVAASFNQGGFTPDLEDPQFPCCGNNSGGMAPGTLQSVPVPVPAGSATATLLATPTYQSAELKSPLVANPTKLFYMAQGSGSSAAAIDAFDRATGVVTTIGAIDSSVAQGILPVGLAADDAHVVWSGAISALMVNMVQPGCWIWAYDLTSSQTSLVFSTTRFSCLDLAVDHDAVYFTIVRSETRDDCGGCTQPLHGDGIGRATLVGNTFESIAFGITTQEGGPRRVYLEGTDLYVVDPLVIGKLSIQAFDGQQDIAP